MSAREELAGALAAAGTTEGEAERITKLIEQVARDEVASLAGLVLARTNEGEAQLTRSHERNIADNVARETLARIFGEALRDFGGTDSEPGTT